MLLEQNWLCVKAAAEGLQKRTEMMERWQQQEVQVKETRWAEEIPQRWSSQKEKDRTEMRKETKLLRCTMLNGSAWSTDRKEKMEEQLNKEAREGWRFAADAIKRHKRRGGT